MSFCFLVWKLLGKYDKINETTFVPVSSDDDHGDTKMLKKGTSLRWIELFNELR